MDHPVNANSIKNINNNQYMHAKYHHHSVHYFHSLMLKILDNRGKPELGNSDLSITFTRLRLLLGIFAELVVGIVS